MSTAQTSGPTARPPKDPQPSVDRIDELARRVLTGDILLPKFQREFVWERQQILDLLDSIMRNYPVGSILLWQSRQELRSENKIADLEIRLPKPDYPVNYLLDGQQRLSAICGALYWEGNNTDSLWNIAYDLRSREFVHLESLDDPPHHQIRMNKVSDPSTFFRHVSAIDTLTASDKEQLKVEASALFNRFKDYKIATVTLGDMSLEDVAPIFERINSTGTRLTIVDLMRAATWREDFDLIDTIDSLREALSDKGFDGIERKAILRSMSAAAGGGFSAESIDDLRLHGASKLKDISMETEGAYRRVVDFISTHVKIPNYSVLPYVNQLVVLAEVFRRVPVPDSRQSDSIHQWFWRTSASGYFSGWNTGMMATDIEAVANFCSGACDEIVVNAVKPSRSIWTGRVFRRNNALSKVLAILLSYNNPVDIITGRIIDTGRALSWVNSKEYHHFFPQNYLKSVGVGTSKINCLANIVMLSSASNKEISDDPPSVYLRRLYEQHGSKLEVWLATHLVGKDAFFAAMDDDFDGFLSARAEMLQNSINDLAGWVSG